MVISEEKKTLTLTARNLPEDIYHGMTKLKGSFGVTTWEDLFGVLGLYEFDDEKMKASKERFHNSSKTQ